MQIETWQAVKKQPIYKKKRKQRSLLRNLSLKINAHQEKQSVEISTGLPLNLSESFAFDNTGILIEWSFTSTMKNIPIQSTDAFQQHNWLNNPEEVIKLTVIALRRIIRFSD
ncbi:hypothetical protein Tsp_09743 [Trichinella spiralis]|uniref:hypothetical protein n=1 Tax=Trichinella spiralis TaxID=6334 RepID=UPI0001EFD723|nr:hypothetical protein Tsp_09743 [Trichinella spiralis]